MNITTHCLKTNSIHIFDLYSLYPCSTNSFFQILILGSRHIKLASKVKGRLTHASRVSPQKLAFKIVVVYHLHYSIFVRIHTHVFVCMCVCVSCIFEFVQSDSMTYTRETPHIWNELIATQSSSIKIVRTVKKKKN